MWRLSVCSVLDGPPPTHDRPQGHCDQNRPVHEHRRGHDEPARARSVLVFLGSPQFDQSSGEVYVLNDGGEVDLDLGNYERYLNVTLCRDNNITTGKIYREVIENEVGPNRASIEHFLPCPFSAVVITSGKQCR